MLRFLEMLGLGHPIPPSPKQTPPSASAVAPSSAPCKGGLHTGSGWSGFGNRRRRREVFIVVGRAQAMLWHRGTRDSYKYEVLKNVSIHAGK